MSSFFTPYNSNNVYVLFEVIEPYQSPFSFTNVTGKRELKVIGVYEDQTEAEMLKNQSTNRHVVASQLVRSRKLTTTLPSTINPQIFPVTPSFNPNPTIPTFNPPSFLTPSTQPFNFFKNPNDMDLS
jgi:hypothetical protein